jgi:hypothetical protein
LPAAEELLKAKKIYRQAEVDKLQAADSIALAVASSEQAQAALDGGQDSILDYTQIKSPRWRGAYRPGGAIRWATWSAPPPKPLATLVSQDPIHVLVSGDPA